MLDMPAEKRQEQAADFSFHVAENFSIHSMVNAVMGGYREALAKRRAVPAAAASTVNSPT
jgi:hypothetical protein